MKKFVKMEKHEDDLAVLKNAQTETQRIVEEVDLHGVEKTTNLQ